MIPGGTAGSAQATVTVSAKQSARIVPVRHDSNLPFSGIALAVNGVVGHQVFPVNLGTRSIGRPISVPIVPNLLAVSPSGREAYALSVISPEVVPIDVATMRAQAAFKLPGNPDDVAASPNGQRLYVTIGTHTFLALDAKTGRLESKLIVPSGVGDIVVNASGTTAYVAATVDEFAPATLQALAGGITAIDLTHVAIVRTWKFPGITDVFAVSPDGRNIYAAVARTGLGAGPSYSYDVSTASAAIGTPKHMNYALRDFTLAPSGATAYFFTGSGVVSLNLSSLKVGRQVNLGFGQYEGIAISADGEHMVVGTYRGVVIVDLADGHVLPPIPLPTASSAPPNNVAGVLSLVLLPPE
jgi:hypothetical protein